MNKFYKIFLLLIIFIFITTYNPKKLNIPSKKNNSLFELKFIKIQDNYLISKSKIDNSLSHLYEKNFFFIKTKKKK